MPGVKRDSSLMSNSTTATARVFIDGEAGTTGLQIRQRLKGIDRIAVISIDPDKRKDPGERQALMAKTDLVVLCLPDEAAREAVKLAGALGDKAPKIVDASTAHRVDDNWVYGFAELTSEQAGRIRTARQVANPGCYPSGAIALIRPLVDAGLMANDHPVTINAVSGYSGGGRQMIEVWEAGRGDAFRLYGLGLNHKHVPELQKYSGLTRRPLFVPSVGNFPRGMLVSVPLHLDQLPGSPAPEDLFTAIKKHYAFTELIKVIATPCTDQQADPALALAAETLEGNDTMELRLYCDADRRQALLVARLDNLGKGAAGAAVQNIKLMLGIDQNATR